MDFADVIRTRRMVRRFSGESIPDDLLEVILRAGLSGPSAGFSQGTDLIVLNEAAAMESFWSLTDPRSRKRPPDGSGPSAIVVVVAGRDTYLERYSEPDKAALGLGDADAWPVAFWDVDAGMAALLMLLAAIDVGLGAWFFGIFHGAAELCSELGIPEGHSPMGAVALGYPHREDRPSGSSATRPRRETDSAIHRGSWGVHEL